MLDLRLSVVLRSHLLFFFFATVPYCTLQPFSIKLSHYANGPLDGAVGPVTSAGKQGDSTEFNLNAPASVATKVSHYISLYERLTRSQDRVHAVPIRPTYNALLHLALERSVRGLQCTEHSVHSKS